MVSLLRICQIAWKLINMNKNIETWLILGASSTISREFALQMAEQNNKIIFAGRDLKNIKKISKDIKIRHNIETEEIEIDIINIQSHNQLVQQCVKKVSGRLNIFVAIGTMPSQKNILNSDGLANKVINTNFTGVVNILLAFMPFFKSQRSGNIIVLGSVAGDRGRLSNYIYGSSKSGIHTFLQGFRSEMEKIGVNVTNIKLGPIDTRMSYGAGFDKIMATPSATAAACISASKNKKSIVYFPWFWKYIMVMIKIIPEKLFNKLSL